MVPKLVAYSRHLPWYVHRETNLQHKWRKPILVESTLYLQHLLPEYPSSRIFSQWSILVLQTNQPPRYLS